MGRKRPIITTTSVVVVVVRLMDFQTQPQTADPLHQRWSSPHVARECVREPPTGSVPNAYAGARNPTSFQSLAIQPLERFVACRSVQFFPQFEESVATPIIAPSSTSQDRLVARPLAKLSIRVCVCVGRCVFFVIPKLCVVIFACISTAPQTTLPS